jgi:radical SAM family uncharacterized protein
MLPQFPDEIESFLPDITKPGRYIGNELNIIRKDPRSVLLRMVLCYPDLYEVGMSNLGLRILYEAVNRLKRFYCERVFAPWPDFEAKLRERNIPLYSLETYTPLSSFDIIGFSIGYELLYTNILNILDLGDIHLRSSDRTEESPLVIAGGPAVFNPEPVADFIDVFVMGDGENAIIELLDRYIELRESSRRDRLEGLNAFNFTFVPSLYRTKRVHGYLVTDMDKIVGRNIEPDLNELPFPRKPLVPLVKIVQDRIAVEMNRGCLSGCRFCLAGYTYRPVRERSPKNVYDIVTNALESTGYDEVSFVSLSIGDYSALRNIVSRVNSRFSEEHVSISLPSLRVNSTNLDILAMIQTVRKSGLTFAIESADRNVRKKLNKIVDEEQLKAIVREVSRMGWRLIKLYFMIGLPMALDEEENIARLVTELIRISKSISINVNISVFVPKPHTPLQRARQLGPYTALKMLTSLQSRFRHSRVRIKFQNPKMSAIEGVLSRGDRSIGNVVYDVFTKGERFSSWDEMFDYRIWEQSLRSFGIDKERFHGFQLETRDLPWHYISIAVNDQWLEQEFSRAEHDTLTGNCLFSQCTHCGVCEQGIRPRLAQKDLIESSDPSLGELDDHFQKNRDDTSTQTPIKVLFQFCKRGLFRFISHLDLLSLLVRVGKSAALHYRYSKGFNPKPRFILPFPLALGIESDYEIGEVFLTRMIDEITFRESFNERLPDGIKVGGAKIFFSQKSVASSDYFHDYRIATDGNQTESVLRCLERIIGKTVIDESPDQFYVAERDSVFLRLDKKHSIKTVFHSDTMRWTDMRIRRIKIWNGEDGQIIPFVR